MKTTSIHIEGQIISPDIIDRLDSGEIKGQSPSDFGFEKGVRLRDEIARAWADAKDQWNIFNRRIENLDETDYGTTETRKYWIIPFLENLGYEVTLDTAKEINGISFAISHCDKKLEGFPVHIVGVNDSLDRRRETGGMRLSPHALVQEYLNITEHLYAIVTNGYQLRILRDSGKIIRLTYLEFDLNQIMEDELYAEFSIMYRLIHSSRMPQKFGLGDESIIESYHQDSLEAGARIRDKLSIAVEKSIMSVANGFLKHPGNAELREKIASNNLSSAELYKYLLRFIYRILFLMVIEERDIIYPETKDEKTKRLKDIYDNYYSISRIRKLSENYFFFDDKLEDLWIALRNTFKIFGDERLSAKLGIYPLDGDLFDYGALGILIDCSLDNHTLLECIRNLSVFEDENTKSLIRVNYGALNVEEFGSVYEGLLEKAPSLTTSGNEVRFSFVESSERSSTGSHYTPEELVQPLIKHSLDYVIEDKIKAVIARSGATKQPAEEIKKAKEDALLSITVCDAACGSGHILLSAARRIAVELARVRTGEDQPSPEPYRHAIRDVINKCIYGVDKNPLAVELCKVALWLEAHNPGMPLNFLDHKIKCGDSIVGLARIEELQNGIATEAFKTLPGDDKDIAAAYRKLNKSERENRAQLKLTDTEEIINNLNTISVKFKNFNLLPDTTVDEVKKKQQEYDVLKGNDWLKLKELADIQAAQFFIDKINANKEFLTTDAEYFRIFAGQKKEVNTRKISQAMAVAAEKKFFHWFLEFPEVFSEGGLPGEVSQSETKTGFDCIVGNPPFLGGQRLTGTFGNNFLEWVKTEFAPVGSCDLVTYFFRRIFELLKPEGFQALLATNTIAQGNAREGGLDVILQKGGNINFAIRSMRWPGVAAVEVAIVALHKGKWRKERFLGNKKVNFISSYIDETDTIGDPFPLAQNAGKSFQGSIVLGKGFILTPDEAQRLIEKNPRNKDVLFPYLNGEDLNTNPDQSPSRWVINFFGWEEEFCKHNYSDCFEIIERLVKPERTRIDEYGEFLLRKPLPQKWWQYCEKRPALYRTISRLRKVLIIAQVSKTVAFDFTKNDKVLDAKLVVFAIEEYCHFASLQSNLHYHWAWKYCTTMKSDLSYTPTAIFETFSFPQNLTKETEAELERIGEEYHEFRRQLMLDMQLGLTKTYNLFHNPECNSDNIAKAKEIREFKNANLQIPIEEAIERIEKLRALHKQMDEAVLKAYGWSERSGDPDSSGTAINLAHDFYEVDYLPENDRVRYTISPEARKEILKRLLELNHKIHEEEVTKGLWEKKGKGKKKNRDNAVDERQGRLF